MIAMDAPRMPDPISPQWVDFLEWLHLDGMHASELRHVMEKPWKYEDLWAAYCDQRETEQ